MLTLPFSHTYRKGGIIVDKLKRLAFPIIIALILLITLIFRLSSCSSQRTIGTPDASAAAPSASGAVSGLTDTSGRMTDEAINSAYSKLGLTVIEIRSTGDETLVQYAKASGDTSIESSRFDWLDRLTGARELICPDVCADKYIVTSDKSLTVLTTGQFTSDGLQLFPELFTAYYKTIDGASYLDTSFQPYYMPLAKSFTLGAARHACLNSLVLNPDNIALGFAAQPGFETEFYADTIVIPQLTLTKDDSFVYVTLYHTVPSKSFVQPKTGAGDAPRRFVSVKSDGMNTVITFKLDKAITRYNITSSISPADGLPYAVLTFSSEEPSYPAGW